VLSFEFMFWASILLVLSLKSWLAFLVFPVGVLFIFTMGKNLSLIPTDKTKSWASKKKALLNFSVFLVVWFTWVYFSGNS